MLSSSFPLQVTPAAVKQVKKMLLKNAGAGIRLTIKETGCAGKSYQLTLLEAPQTNDHILPLAEGLILAVDPASYHWVAGTTMDYGRKGLNEEFIFNNPQSKGICGCGESFYV